MSRSRDFLASDVLPNLAEWSEDHANLRRARNAVNSIAALASHIRMENDRNVGTDEQFKRSLADASDEFEIIIQLTFAETNCTFEDARNIQPETDIHVTRANSGREHNGDGNGGGNELEEFRVVVTVGKHRMRRLDTVAGKAIAFLVGEMLERRI
jgi:hypothetical protein